MSFDGRGVKEYSKSEGFVKIISQCLEKAKNVGII